MLQGNLILRCLYWRIKHPQRRYQGITRISRILQKDENNFLKEKNILQRVEDLEKKNDEKDKENRISY